MFAADPYMIACAPESPQRSRFTKEEDEKLKRLVSLQTPPNWNEISKQMSNRTPRQCRERYANYLRPNLVNGPWTKEENDLLKDLYDKYGPKWSLISQSFKARSSVNIKNHYSSLSSQKAVKEKSNLYHPNNSYVHTSVSESKEHEPKNKEISQALVASNNSSLNSKSANSQAILESRSNSVQNDAYNHLYENIFSNFKNEEDELWSSNFSVFDETMITF